VVTVPLDDYVIREVAGDAGATCRVILRLLPTWFGIEEANANYADVADTAPGVVVEYDGAAVGITTVVHHSKFAAEIFLMAVAPSHHRRGVGSMMLRHVEANLARSGIEFLQVKTLSASNPDEGYAQTRLFYLSYGFRPLEEFPTLWAPGNPALQLIKTVAP
jgi:ribosomal protein S18 acetylase RimI-like enzyme